MFPCETKNHVFPECYTLLASFIFLQLGASPSVNDDFISRAAIHCVGRQWNVKTFSNHVLFSLKKGRGKRNEVGVERRAGQFDAKMAVIATPSKYRSRDDVLYLQGDIC